jgi:DNA-binding beta-propeller fold protein YncE
VTDLRGLKEDIDSLQFPTPPVHDVIELARRSRNRRVRKRVAAAAALLALVVVTTTAIVNPLAKSPGTSRSASGSYLGTASAAFVSRDGLVYVADQANDSLLGLDPTGSPPFEPLSTIPLPFTPGVVAISPNGAMAYVAPLAPEFEGGSNTLYEVNLATHHVVGTIVDHSQSLGSITIAPNGRTAYAWGDDIVPIDLQSGHIRAPMAVANGNYTDFEIAPNGRTAVATTNGPSPAVQEINLMTDTVTRTVSIAHLGLHGTPVRWSPEAVAFSPTGANAYITAEHETGNGTTARLLSMSVDTGKMESSVNLGPALVGNVVIDPNSEKAFVFLQAHLSGAYSYTGAFTVVPVDLSSNEVLPGIVVGHTQGLGLLSFAKASELFAVDTQWNVTGIDETTDRIRSISTIPVPSLRGPSLQPIASGG